jgi:hypothetical protein
LAADAVPVRPAASPPVAHTVRSQDREDDGHVVSAFPQVRLADIWCGEFAGKKP